MPKEDPVLSQHSYTKIRVTAGDASSFQSLQATNIIFPLPVTIFERLPCCIKANLDKKEQTPRRSESKHRKIDQRRNMTQTASNDATLTQAKPWPRSLSLQDRAHLLDRDDWQALIVDEHPSTCLR